MAVERRDIYNDKGALNEIRENMVGREVILDNGEGLVVNPKSREGMDVIPVRREGLGGNPISQEGLDKKLERREGLFGISQHREGFIKPSDKREAFSLQEIQFSGGNESSSWVTDDSSALQEVV